MGLRRRLLELDRRMLGECRHVFTNAQNTVTRLEKFNGVAARALYHHHPWPTGCGLATTGRTCLWLDVSKR